MERETERERESWRERRRERQRERRRERRRHALGMVGGGEWIWQAGSADCGMRHSVV